MACKICGRPACASWMHTAEARDEYDSLCATATSLADACNDLLGLLQLIASRPDISDELRAVLTDNYRISQARAALAELDKPQT